MSAKNFKPLGARVLVKRSESQKMKGGILLPDNAKEKPRQGEVLAVGPGKYDKEGKLHPLQLKVGDVVLFGAYAGNEVKSDEMDTEYLIIAEEDVLGVLV
jgi:chaperonin GroES